MANSFLYVNRSFVFLIGLLVISGFISWTLYFRAAQQKDTINIHTFPVQIGDWKSEELPITDEEYAILETRNAFARRYFTEKGGEVYLLIVYSQSNRKVSHPPEICYTGSGASISSSDKVGLRLTSGAQMQANRYFVGIGQARQIMYYFFKVGNQFTPNYWHQQVLIGFNTLLGRKTGSALVRLTVTVNDQGEHGAQRDVEHFMSDVQPLLLKFLP